MSVDGMRCNPVPLKSSNLKNMKEPSGSSDSSSESDSEMTQEYYPPPRPTGRQGETIYEMSEEGEYLMEPEPSTTHSKESRRTSERPPIDSRGASTRVPPVAPVISSTYQPDKRRSKCRSDLSRHKSVPVTSSKSRDYDRSDKLFAEYEYGGTMRKSFGDPPEPLKAPEEDKAPYKSGSVWICPMPAQSNIKLLRIDSHKGAHVGVYPINTERIVINLAEIPSLQKPIPFS